MDIVFKILLFLHLLGMAYLLGGLLIQIKDKKKTLNRGIMDGTLAQLITGPLLYWIALTNNGNEELNHMALGVKIVLLIVMVVVVLINRRAKTLSNTSYYILLFSAVAAVGFAVLIG